MVKTVLIAGDFGVIHEGHIDHIEKAYRLGDWLYIVTHPDSIILKHKGYKPVSLSARVKLLKGLLSLLGGCGEVIVDPNRTVENTLRKIQPDIYAKGGDRLPDNMPDEEIKACNEIGCKVVYGVGSLLGSSRSFVGGGGWATMKS